MDVVSPVSTKRKTRSEKWRTRNDKRTRNEVYTKETITIITRSRGRNDNDKKTKNDKKKRNDIRNDKKTRNDKWLRSA